MNKEHNCEIFGKKYSIIKLPIRKAAGVELRVMSMLAAIERGNVTNEDDFFDTGCRLLEYTLVNGQELSSQSEIEAYFEEAGIEEFNLAVMEAVKANFPKLLGKLDLSAALDKVQEALNESE